MMLDLESDGAGHYGLLFVGRHLKVPCLFGDITKYVNSKAQRNVSHNKFAADIGSELRDTNNERWRSTIPAFSDSMSYKRAKHMMPDALAKETSRSRGYGSGSPYEDNNYIGAVLDDISWTNGFIEETDRNDEPADSHMRDHCWNVNLRGRFKYRMRSDNAEPLDFNPEMGFTFDYCWRLPRHQGDIRRVPVINAEIECTKPYQPGNASSTWFCIHTAEGPLRFIIRRHLYSLDRHTDHRSLMGRIMYTRTSAAMKMIIAKHVLLCMKHFHMSRKKAFRLLNIEWTEVFEKNADRLTYDRPVLLNLPDAQVPDNLWDEERYSLFGEPYLTGNVSEEDASLFKERFPHFAELLEAMDRLYEHGLTLDDLIYPTHPGDSHEAVISGLRYPSTVYSKLEKWEEEAKEHAGDSVNEYNTYLAIGGGWMYGTPPLDFEWLKRLGTIPCLPRLCGLQPYDFQEYPEFASYKMKTYPCGCFIMDGGNFNRELDKLEEALGWKLDREAFIKDLEARIEGRQRRMMVFVTGVMEFIPIKREKIIENLKRKWGEEEVIVLE